MTCIVGIAQEGKIFMGGDSSAVDEHNNFITVRREPKVFINGEYIIGYAGSFRFGKIMQHSFNPPSPDTNDIDKFLNTSFIDYLRESCEAAKIDPSSEDHGSQLLLGIRGRLFEFCDDWHFGEDTTEYAAIGSGSSYAYGSLFSTKKLKSPASRIKLALEAAETFSTYVRSPFTILER